jgi:hypothetical protein
MAGAFSIGVTRTKIVGHSQIPTFGKVCHNGDGQAQTGSGPTIAFLYGVQLRQAPHCDSCGEPFVSFPLIQFHATMRIESPSSSCNKGSTENQLHDMKARAIPESPFSV